MGRTGVKLRGMFGFPDNLRFYVWKQFKVPCVLRARLRGGPTLLMRPRPAHDRGIAREVFAEGMYALPAGWHGADGKSEPVRTIVDLGANVGYSILYFLREHAGSRVIAFEPHPAHVEWIRRHLEVNGVEAGRVELHAVAAGNVAARLMLTDAGATSALVGEGRDGAGAGAMPVEVVDVFGVLGGMTIDLLKMDIEGGEYAILDDPRFAGLRMRWLVMECHRTAAVARPRGYCRRRLETLGYEVLPRAGGEATGASVEEERTSVLWARR